MLPSTLNSAGGSVSGTTTKLRAWRYKFLRRLCAVRQMDFQFALTQMLWLIVAPSRVYKNIFYHKRTKNQWARDDPAFLVLLFAWLCIAALGLCFAFSTDPLHFIKFVLWLVFVDCVSVGLVISSLLWVIFNRFFRSVQRPHTTDEELEWGYCFDVHCNSFFPLLLVLHVIQLFLLPIILQDKITFVSVFVGNSLWLIALSYYVYITFLGYNAMPFLEKTTIILYPIALFFIGYIFTLIFQWNISRTVFRFYKLM